MNFCIEPAQTMWSFVDTEHYVAHCRLRAPKGSLVIGIDTNHVLMKHGFVDDPKRVDAFEHIEFVAIQLGCVVPETNWNNKLTFIGVIRLGEQIASYAVFATKSQQTIIHNVVINFTDAFDPAKLAEAIESQLRQNLGGSASGAAG